MNGDTKREEKQGNWGEEEGNGERWCAALGPGPEASYDGEILYGMSSDGAFQYEFEKLQECGATLCVLSIGRCQLLPRATPLYRSAKSRRC